MEEEIIEEGNPQEKKQGPASKIKLPKIKVRSLAPKVKNFILNFKRPKLITLITLFTTLVLISLALNLLIQKTQTQNAQQQASQQISSPKATAEETNSSISQRVKSYEDELDHLDNYQKKLAKPIVDLDISFKQ